MADICFEDLGFAYAGQTTPALAGVSLMLPTGAYACVCGKSGCGKSTLLQQLKPALLAQGQRSGRVLVDGIALEELPSIDQASRIGFVAQDPDAQIVCDSVWRELAFGLESLGIDQEPMRQRVAETASFFGMQSWFDKPVLELSGGQKQLLNLASAMVLHPDVLVLDEPTSQLDPIAATAFLTMLRRINQELGTTVLMSEHRLEEVFPVADAIVVLEKGRVAFYGAPREVADELYRARDDMTCALPTPTRVFHGVEDLETSSRESTCPLSVREGRAWLSAWVGAHDPQRRSVDREEGVDVSAESAVRLKDLWFRYDRHGADILRGACLDVPSSSIFALVGGNGAGKTTLLKCICGVVKPFRGSASVLGRRLGALSGERLVAHGIASLPQDPKCLFAKETVRAELEEMIDGAAFDARERDERVRGILQLCHIAHLADKNPHDLSGGEQQCVALAKVLLTQPRLLLLDEPTKGMDAFLKRQLARILRRLRTEGTAIILASHDIEFCARCADEVGMLFDGELASRASVRAFFTANDFYTTAAHRMSKGVFEGAMTDEDVIDLCLS